MQALLNSENRFYWNNGISLKKIVNHYKSKVIVTWVLLLGESLSVLFLPLAIGYSVDSLLQKSHSGILFLGGLCLVILFFGAARRFYDTRTYALIYRDLANSLVEHKSSNGIATSSLTAQVNLLYEIVDFFEDSLPALIAAVISFLGVIILLGMINMTVLLGCLVTTALVALIYILSEKKIYAYNQNQNDELERQVKVLNENRKRRVHAHFARLMKWNIKLSDLETINYSLIWLVLAILLIFSIIIIVADTAISYGEKITVIMYVFEFIEVILALPLYYQQLIRLQEITTRLSVSEN